MSPISLKQDDIVEGGGLIDDIDVRFVKCRFEMFDYGGNAKVEVPSLGIEMQPVDGGDIIKQNWSIGKKSDWRVDAGGKGITPVSDRIKGISDKSNLGILLNSIFDAGFPQDRIDDDISVLEDMVCHVLRVAPPARPGLKSEKKNKDFETTILTVSEILYYPWEEKKSGAAAAADKAKGGGKAKSKSKSKAKDKGNNKGADSDVDVEAEAIACITTVLEEAKDNRISVRRLAPAMFKIIKDHPARNEIASHATSDEFLESQTFFDYDDGFLALPE